MLSASLNKTFPSFLTNSVCFRGGGWGSGVMSELAAMVHSCPAVRSKLGPALLRSYVAVDVVEGLDVDRDEFDKYSARWALYG